MEVAEDEFGEFFGHGVFGGAVTGEDVVAFGLGVGFVDEGGVVEGFAHFHVAALATGEGSALDVGFGVGLGGLGIELGVGDGIGVEAGVVLGALGVAEDAVGRGGCDVAVLTIQGGQPRCLEEFQGCAVFAHEAGEGEDGVGVRVFGGTGFGRGRTRAGRPCPRGGRPCFIGRPEVGGLGELGGGGVDEDLEHGNVVGGVDAHGVGVGLGFDDG